MENDFWNRPCASHGLHSYRLRGPYGWIMIGARDHEDAMREAARSTPSPSREALGVWNGVEYVKAFEPDSGFYFKDEWGDYVYQEV